ncbi:hypothetical protein [uncultured Sphingomonas sp.]|uniref:hypothetical protein n=1 Tax=uncultured Sphingomonas sp. TaxID=158754 RepID=UPI0025D88E67|nr:hypothetical protein [uncultured Sphingomonas sp.]
MFDTAPPEAARLIIEGLGGPPKVAEMTKAPVTTVHSWMRVGLTRARLDHMRLAAAREGAEFDFDEAIASVHSEVVTA